MSTNAGRKMSVVQGADLNPDDDLAGGEMARRILDTAYALFLDFGFRRTTMEDVARRLGTSRITLYRHFGDKDALFQAVVIRECRRTMRAIQEQLASVAAPEDFFVEGIVLTLTRARSHPLIRRLLETEPEWLLPHLTVKSGPLFSMALAYGAGYFREQQSHGHFRPFPSELASELLVRMMQSAVLTPGGLLASDNDDDVRQVARMIFLPLLKGSRME